MSELDSYSALDGYPGPRIPGLEPTAAWLADNRPTTWRPMVAACPWRRGATRASTTRS